MVKEMDGSATFGPHPLMIPATAPSANEDSVKRDDFLRKMKSFRPQAVRKRKLQIYRACHKK
jgi:hypothetical protein